MMMRSPVKKREELVLGLPSGAGDRSLRPAQKNREPEDPDRPDSLQTTRARLSDFKTFASLSLLPCTISDTLQLTWASGKIPGEKN